ARRPLGHPYHPSAARRLSADGVQPRPGPRHAPCGRGATDVVRAMVAATVDEERRCARNGAEVGAVDILGHACGTGVLAEVTGEALDVETQLLGVCHEVAGLECVLMLEQEIVQLPKRPLRGRSLCCLRCELRL